MLSVFFRSFRDFVIIPLQESRMKRSFLLLGLVSILWVSTAPGCSQQPPTPDLPPETETPGSWLTEISLPAGYGAHASWIDIYFTDPESPHSSQETGGIDGPLAASIDAARLTVDVAVYSLNLRSIRDALIRAHQRGVQVRVVMESDNLDGSAPQALIEAGIPVLGDRREGLMHNKFVVIDRSEVWMGSMNFTYSGTYEDNNQLILFRSVKMAENYTKEFEEMFIDDKFGDNVIPETPNPKIKIDDTNIEIYYSPDDGVATPLQEILNRAEKSIYFMAFSFTTDEFGEVIRTKAENGLTIAGVMEDEQVKTNIGTEYDLFKQAGLDVFIDGNRGQMHHKTMIVDGRIVITGSYNFSRSAETRNDENLIVIYNEQIADFFLQEFRRVYQQAQH
jgi:phosphatidylserine/phosphatidylglycerophosphate/cardiolipin synthase-like enzyme